MNFTNSSGDSCSDMVVKPTRSENITKTSRFSPNRRTSTSPFSIIFRSCGDIECWIAFANFLRSPQSRRTLTIKCKEVPANKPKAMGNGSSHRSKFIQRPALVKIGPRILITRAIDSSDVGVWGSITRRSANQIRNQPIIIRTYHWIPESSTPRPPDKISEIICTGKTAPELIGSIGVGLTSSKP